MTDRTIDSKLLSANIAITNALNSTKVKTYLATFGYTEERISEGAQLLEAANALIQTQTQLYGQQYRATDELKEARENAHDRYVIHLKVARIAFEGEEKAIESLLLKGRRKKDLPGWLEQTSVFYGNLLKESIFLSSMSQFGINKEQLEEAYEDIQQVSNKHAQQLQAKGAAQQATIVRNQAIDKLLDWMADFRSIAKLALISDQQLLEALGIKVAS